MFVKIIAGLLTLALVPAGLCACGKKRMSGEEQRQYEQTHQAEIEEAARELKEKGIVDEHGVPAPGIDLNDYPGLG